MAVIKREFADAMSRGAVVLDLGDIARQAELLREQAQARADKIILDAEKTREDLINSGFEQGERNGHAVGYREGLAKGEEEGRQRATVEARQQLETIENAWVTALDDFADKRHHLLVESKESVLRLALAIAERVIHRQIEMDDRVVLAQVEHALRLVGRPTRVTVLIHPEDGAMVRRALPTISARFGAIEHVLCEEDESVERGGCRVMTDEGGEIDASIRTQIERIARTLLPGSARLEAKPDSRDEREDREDRAA